MPPTEQESNASRWDDYADVFLAPTELFSRRGGTDWVQPFFIVLLLDVTLYFLFLPVHEALIQSRIVADPAAGEAYQRFGDLIQILGGFMSPIRHGLAILMTAVWMRGVAWLTAIETDLSGTLLIATFAAFVSVPQTLAEAVAVLPKIYAGHTTGIDQIHDLSFGVLRFLRGGNVPAVAIPALDRIDVFVLWQVGLWAVGLRTAARCSWTKAGTVAAIVALSSAVPDTLGAWFLSVR